MKKIHKYNKLLDENIEYLHDLEAGKDFLNRAKIILAIKEKLLGSHLY